MVKATLSTPEVQRRGWLLDGYPRSESQATAIEREGIRPELFLLIKVRACGEKAGKGMCPELSLSPLFKSCACE